MESNGHDFDGNTANSNLSSRLRGSGGTLNARDYTVDDMDSLDIDQPLPRENQIRKRDQEEESTNDRRGRSNNQDGRGYIREIDINQDEEGEDVGHEKRDVSSNPPPGKPIAPRRGVAPPPGRPPPRKASDALTNDDEEEDDGDAKPTRPPPRNGNSRNVDDIMKQPPMGRSALSEQLHEDDEGDMEMDIKVIGCFGDDIMQRLYYLLYLSFTC